MFPSLSQRILKQDLQLDHLLPFSFVWREENPDGENSSEEASETITNLLGGVKKQNPRML